MIDPTPAIPPSQSAEMRPEDWKPYCWCETLHKAGAPAFAKCPACLGVELGQLRQEHTALLAAYDAQGRELAELRSDFDSFAEHHRVTETTLYREHEAKEQAEASAQAQAQRLAEAEAHIVSLCNARDDAEGRFIHARATLAEAEAELNKLHAPPPDLPPHFIVSRHLLSGDSEFHIGKTLLQSFAAFTHDKRNRERDWDNLVLVWERDFIALPAAPRREGGTE